MSVAEVCTRQRGGLITKMFAEGSCWPRIDSGRYRHLVAILFGERTSQSQYGVVIQRISDLARVHTLNLKSLSPERGKGIVCYSTK